LCVYQEYKDVAKDLSVDEVHPDLAYHINLMEVLAGCTVGRLNITTIEAKVQSIFNFVDILHALLDPRTILLAKIRMSLYFFNAIVEVEMRVSGLERCPAIWKLLESFPTIFTSAKDELRVIEKYGWNAPSVSKQRIEHMLGKKRDIT